MYKSILILLMLAMVIPAAGQSNLKDSSKVISVEYQSGVHFDVVNALSESVYVQGYYAPGFDLQPVLTGWMHRIGFNLELNKKWTLTSRVGFTTFRREYIYSGKDPLQKFNDSYFIERYFPIDLLISRVIRVNNKFNVKIGIGPIIRLFDDSGHSYSTLQDIDGNLHMIEISSDSRDFGDIGFTYDLHFKYQINTNLQAGLDFNCYTLFGGYGLEGVIFSPSIEIRLK